MMQKVLSILLFSSVAAHIHADSLVNFHLGVDMGFQRLNTKIENELHKNGYSGTLKGGLIVSFKEWELETDLGMRYSRLSGTQSGVEQRLSFLTLWGEISPRYRLDEALSIGPTFDFLFGTDTSHTEAPSAGTSNMTSLVGLSARYRFPDSALSLNGRVTTDLNLAEQRLLVFGLGLLWHFGDRPKISDQPVMSMFQEAPPESLMVEEPRAEVQVEKNYILVRIPEDVILFETAMSHLNPRQKAYVRALGDVLKNYDGRWSRISVMGHTDYRGPESVNQVLSEARAASVRTELILAGISEDRLEARGMGESQPLDLGKEPDALQRNRRVEIKVDGIEEGSDLATELENIIP
jgi:outer membrane protein OmpA-like peptidoglycan-associated protein